jgi:uncharacterized membrane protein HdeD (DUF308 family)
VTGCSQVALVRATGQPRERGGRHMTAVGITQPREPAVGKWWWVLLVTGIAWIVFGLFVLQAHYGSAVAIGYVVGFWLLLGGVAEFIEMGVIAGWKWVHAVLGVLFIVGGVAALTSPFQTFMILASLVGFFLILKGTFDFVLALAMRHAIDLWWMGLIAGIIQIALGIWAMGYPGRSAALLLIWVGIGAIVRGIAEIVTGFHVHKLPEAVVVA